MKIRWTGTEYEWEYSAEERAALVSYYRDPEVVWLRGGTDAVGGPLPKEGYYALAHCGRIGCCRPAGPFETPAEARDWSREHWVPGIGSPTP